MAIVVTGAAGFIGANLVRALNARGERDVLAVDRLDGSDKFRNLVGCDLADYLDADEFVDRLEAGDFDGDLAAILHQGACSDTMERDGAFMMRNNHRYSTRLLEHCQNDDVPFLYASSAAVYGGGTTFVEAREHEAPLNVYAYSKALFDDRVRRTLPERTAPIAGFRYFNVYGPHEGHKGRMASVVWHFFHQYLAEGRVKLFEGTGGIANGEQRRDFVSVEDVVRVNLDFLDHPERSGIFNVGSGRAETYNAVAAAVINAVRATEGASPSSVEALVREGAIGYIPFPPALAGRYQNFTQADLTKLRAAGYREPTLELVQGVRNYVEWMMARDRA
ncbi:MAG: ADP-glyceromanno-heptose 6-epimerase [Burkholderiales bacterium]|nr:ADP-glyceromanno-heptose 6-epimerase [Burkholderiales bacterium]MCE7877202.1 ADP-glyceromanno-heptose 6-epimerase [Betaproteobacteria bacterium PRO3]